MTEKWDKLEVLNQVGPRGYVVKPWVNIWSLVGGGLEETNLVAWDPLWWSQNTTKVVVVGCRPADAGAKGALQLTLEGCGAHHKNLKNKRDVGS